MLRSFPNLSVKESPIIPSDKTNTSNAPESNEPSMILPPAGGSIIDGSLDSGAFDVFVLSDGMIGDSLTDRFGNDLNKSFGSLPGSMGKGATIFKGVAGGAGIDSSGPYTSESYDAAAAAS